MYKIIFNQLTELDLLKLKYSFKHNTWTFGDTKTDADCCISKREQTLEVAFTTLSFGTALKLSSLSHSYVLNSSNPKFTPFSLLFLFSTQNMSRTPHQNSRFITPISITSWLQLPPHCLLHNFITRFSLSIYIPLSTFTFLEKEIASSSKFCRQIHQLNFLSASL